MSQDRNPDDSYTGLFNVQARNVAPADRSGTVAVGGSAQQLAPANLTRRGWRLQNQSAGDLWVNDKGGTATASQPSLRIAANSYYESPITGCSNRVLSVYGATTGQAFEASEW